MQITVPNNLGANPLYITIDGVRYALGAGETVDVPVAVVEEMKRMQASMAHPMPPVDLPFKDAAQEAAIQALDTRMGAVETAAAQKELPDFPETEGTYSLQAVTDDGETTLSWEAVEAASEPAGT